MSDNFKNNFTVVFSESENNENQMRMFEFKQEIFLKTYILFISIYDYFFLLFLIKQSVLIHNYFISSHLIS